MNNIEYIVDEAISSLSEDFEENPNKYLTEEDMRIHLCFRLMPHFGGIQETADGDSSIALHSEIRWWGFGRRRDRSDIVILDVSSMNVTNEIVKEEYGLGLIPSKGYSAIRSLAAIELKFRRPGGPSDEKFIESIDIDIKKLRGIRRTIGARLDTPPLICRVVAFDKKSPLQNTNWASNEIGTAYKFANQKRC